VNSGVDLLDIFSTLNEPNIVIVSFVYKLQSIGVLILLRLIPFK